MPWGVAPAAARQEGVKIARRAVNDSSNQPPARDRGVWTTGMADVAFVLLTLVVFGVLALVVKAVEKL